MVVEDYAAGMEQLRGSDDVPAIAPALGEILAIDATDIPVWSMQNHNFSPTPFSCPCVAAKTKRPSEPRNSIFPKPRKAEAKIRRKNRHERESLYRGKPEGRGNDSVAKQSGKGPSRSVSEDTVASPPSKGRLGARRAPSATGYPAGPTTEKDVKLPGSYV